MGPRDDGPALHRFGVPQLAHPNRESDTFGLPVRAGARRYPEPPRSVAPRERRPDNELTQPPFGIDFAF